MLTPLRITSLVFILQSLNQSRDLNAKFVGCRFAGFWSFLLTRDSMPYRIGADGSAPPLNCASVETCFRRRIAVGSIVACPSVGNFNEKVLSPPLPSNFSDAHEPQFTRERLETVGCPLGGLSLGGVAEPEFERYKIDVLFEQEMAFEFGTVPIRFDDLRKATPAANNILLKPLCHVLRHGEIMWQISNERDKLFNFYFNGAERVVAVNEDNNLLGEVR